MYSLRYSTLFTTFVLQLLLDGRDVTVPGYEKGNFVGPTILHDVKVRCV